MKSSNLERTASWHAIPAMLEALTELQSNPSLRRAMGEEGRKLVEARYSVQGSGAEPAELLHGAVSGR